MRKSSNVAGKPGEPLRVLPKEVHHVAIFHHPVVLFQFFPGLVLLGLIFGSMILTSDKGFFFQPQALTWQRKFSRNRYQGNNLFNHNCSKKIASSSTDCVTMDKMIFQLLHLIRSNSRR